MAQTTKANAVTTYLPRYGGTYKAPDNFPEQKTSFQNSITISFSQSLSLDLKHTNA